MNERIRELIRLADVHILPDDSEYGHCIIGLEKFAEAIVRECAEVAGCNGHVSGFTLGDLIKEHFGVE